MKVTEELEKIILELRLNNRFGPMRIRFRLKRKYGVSLGTKTIYNILKIHKLNVLSVKLKRKYKRFEMKRPNELVQMDTKGPFYLKASRTKHYFIHAIDDCSRRVVSKWCNRRTSEEALLVLKEWVKLHGKPMKVMHDGGKEFTSTKFRNFLNSNGIKNKQIPKGYPHAQNLYYVNALNNAVMPGGWSYLYGSYSNTFVWHTEADREKNNKMRYNRGEKEACHRSQSVFEIFLHYNYSYHDKESKKNYN